MFTIYIIYHKCPYGTHRKRRASPHFLIDIVNRIGIIEEPDNKINQNQNR